MTSIRIAAVGDILMWRRQIAAARGPAASSYSFESMFHEVAPYLRSADLTIGNLETTLSGRERVYQRQNAKTGWPMFNCPDELARALKGAGMDVLTTANNHCLDRGISGLNRTLRVLDQAGLRHTGTYRTKADAGVLLVQKVKGIRVGILSYTYGTNGISVPKDAIWAVNRIGSAKIRSDLQRMRKQADVSVVVLHFGQEFQRYPNERQKSLVNYAFQNGADIVLGVHPHVLQPMARRNVRSQDGRTAQKFVIYSLGNFISDRMMAKIHSDSGVIVNIDLVKDRRGTIVLKRIQTIPTWVHQYSTHGVTKFRVLPVKKFLSSPDDKLSKQDLGTLRRVYQLTGSHLHLSSDRYPGAKSQAGTWVSVLHRRGAGGGDASTKTRSPEP